MDFPHEDLCHVALPLLLMLKRPQPDGMIGIAQSVTGGAIEESNTSHMGFVIALIAMEFLSLYLPLSRCPCPSHKIHTGTSKQSQKWESSPWQTSH